MRTTGAGHRRRWWQRWPTVVVSNDVQPGAAASAPASSRATPGREVDGRRAGRYPRLGLGLAVVLGVAVAAWLLARSDSGPEPAEPPAVATTAAPTTAPVDPAKLAEGAYIAFEEAFAAAGAIPDPDHPGLRETATGQALADAVEQLSAWRLSGRVARAVGPVADGVRVLGSSLSTDGAHVRACHVNDDQVVVADTGQVVNDDVVTRLYDVAVVQEGDRWKVSHLSVLERWEGVAGCAGDRA